MNKVFKGFSIALMATIAVAANTAGASVREVSSATANAAGMTLVNYLQTIVSTAEYGDEIVVANGTYQLSSTLTVAARGVTLRSQDGKSGVTFMPAGDPIQLLSIGAEEFTVSGIAFKNGKGTNGGAIFFTSSSFTTTAKILNCAFEDCKAKWGAAIYGRTYKRDDFTSECGLVEGCAFIRCGAVPDGDSWSGGAVRGAFNIVNCVFDACYTCEDASLSYHAAIDATGATVVSNCVFKNHSYFRCGIVGAAEDNSSAVVKVFNSQFLNNVSTADRIELLHRTVAIDGCIFSNNTTTVSYAGNGKTTPALWSDDKSGCEVKNSLFIDNGYPLRLAKRPFVNCTFVRNVGGLVFHYDDVSKAPAITNCLFWQNYEIPETDRPGGINKGGPGLYWHGASKLDEILRAANIVIDGVNGNSDLETLLQNGDPSGKSLALSRSAAISTPGFVDAANGDFRLTRQSVLVDQGVRFDWMVGSVDVIGNPRLTRAGFVEASGTMLPDIGCYECFTRSRFFIYIR